jgi:hypothetical protein
VSGRQELWAVVLAAGDGTRLAVPLDARDSAPSGFTSPIPDFCFATHVAHPGA